LITSSKSGACSSGLPTRLHQQVRKAEEKCGRDNAEGVPLGSNFNTTEQVVDFESTLIDQYYHRDGKVLEGNENSWDPAKKVGNQNRLKSEISL
jgi:hypothetical protein